MSQLVSYSELVNEWMKTDSLTLYTDARNGPTDQLDQWNNFTAKKEIARLITSLKLGLWTPANIYIYILVLWVECIP